MQRSPEMESLLNSFMPKRKERPEQNKCVTCGADVNPMSFQDAISFKEWRISGMCQTCQDSVFNSEEE